MAINKTEAGTWAVDFRDQHKRRIQRTFDTYKEAASFEKDALAQVSKREYVKPSEKTIHEVSEEWYQRKIDAGTYRRASLIDYHNQVENYIKPTLGHWKLQDIDIEHVEKAAAEWGKRVSPKMVNKVLTTLTSIVALAKRYKLIKDNPAKEAERLKIATENEDDIEVTDLVFARDDGKPYHRNAASDALDTAITKAEIKRLTPHGLRHTFASLLLADGVAVPEVSALLGHKDSYVTWKVYAHFVKKESNAVHNLAASILAGS
jgi:hypothetical protein